MTDPTTPADEIAATTMTCGVCGRPVTIEDLAEPPPTFTNVQVGTTDDGKPIVKPTLNKPIRMDPETGAVCWCPNDEEQP